VWLGLPGGCFQSDGGLIVEQWPVSSSSDCSWFATAWMQVAYIDQYLPPELSSGQRWWCDLRWIDRLVQMFASKHNACNPELKQAFDCSNVVIVHVLCEPYLV